MEFFKNRQYSQSLKFYMSLFGLFLLINSVKASESEDNFYSKIIQKSNDFEKVYFQNSISYGEYDSLDGQLKSFFGLNSDLSKTNYFPDLNIISSSDALRTNYKLKLNDMIINKSTYKLKK